MSQADREADAEASESLTPRCPSHCASFTATRDANENSDSLLRWRGFRTRTVATITVSDNAGVNLTAIHPPSPHREPG